MYPTDATLGPSHAATAAPLRQTLADAQERHAANVRKSQSLALSVRYTLMFELTDNATLTETLREIRAFIRNASISEVIGISDGQKEDHINIDVIASPDDKGTMLDLARLLKVIHRQESVLVSWASVNTVVI